MLVVFAGGGLSPSGMDGCLFVFSRLGSVLVLYQSVMSASKLPLAIDLSPSCHALISVPLSDLLTGFCGALRWSESIWDSPLDRRGALEQVRLYPKSDLPGELQ